jgi:lysophospholipase L1-like esterase
MKRRFFTAIVVVVLLAILEIASRLILNRIYNRKFDSSLIVDNKYFKSPGLKENATGMVWGKLFHTDQFACRKGPKPYSSKKKKWLFIGDSVTEGVGMDDSSTFAAFVAAKSDSFNIMNYSLIGYADGEYLDILKTLLSNNDSSISKVTIFFCLNDVYGRNRPSELPGMMRPNLLGRINSLLQDDYATYKLIKLFFYQNSDSYFRYDSRLYVANGRLFIRSMGYLEQCNQVCRKAGVQMNVVMMPYRSQLVRNDDATRNPQNMVKEFCFKQHIPFADPIDFCSKSANPKDLYLFADEIHFSEAGHKMMTDYILSH